MTEEENQHQLVIKIEPMPTHCKLCKAEYQHIGHPFYSGAIMMSVCKCRMEMETKDNVTIIRFIPPDDL